MENEFGIERYGACVWNDTNKVWEKLPYPFDVTIVSGISVSLDSSDIQIGAVEIKDGDSDTRLDVETDSTKNAAFVQSESLALAANQLADGHNVTVDNTSIEQTTGAAHTDENIAVCGKDDSGNVLPIPVIADGVEVASKAQIHSQQHHTVVSDHGFEYLSLTEWMELRTRDQRQLDVANCNVHTEYTVLSNDTTNKADTTDHVFGVGAITFDKEDGTDGSVYAGVQRTLTSLNFSEIFETGAFVGLGCKLTSVADVEAIFVRIGTDSSNYNEWEWGVDDLTVGRWMALRQPTNQPTGYAGNGWNQAAVTYVAFGVEFSDEADDLTAIKFDNVHLVGGRVTDTVADASIVASINTPNINVHRMGGTPVDTNAGNVSSATQRVTLATDDVNLAAIKTAVEAATPAGTNNIGDVDIASDLPIDRAVDNIGVALQTDKIMLDTTALTPLFAPISATTTGDNTIVAASAGFQIRVLALFLVASADDTDVRFESAAAGTALTGAVPLLESTGFVLPFNPVGWFQTDTTGDELLNMEITGVGDVFGSLTYILVPD